MEADKKTDHSSPVRRQNSSLSKKSSCLSRRNSCLSNDSVNEPNWSPKKKDVGFSRETTRTITQVPIKDSGSRNTTTLFLSRSCSKVHPSSTPSCLSRQTTGTKSKRTTFVLSDEEQFKPRVERQFTFTGYDIMADCDPPKSPPTEPDEVERREYVNVYINACKYLDLIPCTFLLDSFMSSSLVMRSRSLGPKAARALLIALVDNRRVQSLDLEDNWLGPEGTAAIAELLSQNSFITEVNISENRIGGNGMMTLAAALRDNQTVRKLDISGGELYDHDARFLADLIENNVRLRELRASHNKFGEIGGLYLGPAIANNDTLEVLDLSWNHLRRKGAMAVAAGLEENMGLLELDLSWNGFSRTGCKVLGLSLIENDTLEQLDLTCNRVDTFGVGFILDGLRWNETLTTLRLGQNPITPNVALLIIQTLEKAKNSAIRDLDLMDVVVDEEFVSSLKKMQHKHVLRTRTGPIIHKGEGILQEDPGTYLTNNPMQAMFDFITERGYRVTDLFKRYDNDNSFTVSAHDFTKALLTAHLPLTVGQLEGLVEELDEDKDGRIDLRHLTEAEKLYRRKKFRQKQKVSSVGNPASRKRVLKRGTKKGSLRLPVIPDAEALVQA